ncbi:MAG TPA: UDP-glucose/GDP-mannose dehydrogenase family protein [Longimicrobium sp.]|nr:UDP-glucose/GDP-mannose dehydrogenase family protein [Longimicrobium sp.]
MKIAVVGTGYVGLVAGACLAETGNDVTCADIDEGKITRLNAGEIPIYEPGLEPMVERNLRDGRLSFTTDVAAAAAEAEVIFIAVGTPPGEDGSADLKHVLAVAETIGRSMPQDGPEKIVITKSTVPVGTAARVKEAIRRHASRPFHVCSNPEFLKEGAALQDFMKPDRVVIGVESEHARQRLGELYAPFVRTGNPILFMDIASAEITKYAANAMLATRISFMNTIAQLCEAVGADVGLVRQGIGTDERIGPGFLFAGIGYGGSCFPKDVKALVHTLNATGVDAAILEGVEKVNAAQKRVLLRRVVARFGDDLSGRTFAVWGLSFKPETDDMREAPSLEVVRGLVQRGARVRAHDPEARDEAARHYFADLVAEGSLALCEHNYDCLEGADALLILTEWLAYRNPDFDRIRASLAEPVILDGRNLWDPARMAEMGFECTSIGRAPSGVPAEAGAAD